MMERPRYLDRFGIDRLLALFVSLLIIVGCEIPPGPIVPKPDPINPPVTQGQRIALILHESHDQTPEFARLIVDLQFGESSAYFAKNHHSVFALDIDAKDENKQPLQVITKLKPIIGNKPLPVLIVANKSADGRLDKVLYCESIKNDAGGSDVVSTMKKTGGGE